MTDSHMLYTVVEMLLCVRSAHTVLAEVIFLKGKINNILPRVDKNNPCFRVLFASHDDLRTVSRSLTGGEKQLLKVVLLTGSAHCYGGATAWLG